MKAWRRTGRHLPAEAAPTCILVISVTEIAGGARWTFGSTIDAINDTGAFLIDGNPPTGIAGSAGATVDFTYAAGSTVGLPWSITDPSAITFDPDVPLCTPQSGIVG